jgi:uncharacterized damage-inducible protein DinB
VLEGARTAEAALTMMFGRLRMRLADPDVDLGYRPDDTWSRYGSLIKHICYTTQGYVAVRMGGLDVALPPSEEHWSADGLVRESLERLVDETAALCHRALEGMTATAWEEEVELYGRRLRRGDLPLFAALHGSQHVGQMLLMDRVRKTAAVR